MTFLFKKYIYFRKNSAFIRRQKHIRTFLCYDTIPQQRFQLHVLANVYSVYLNFLIQRARTFFHTEYFQIIELSRTPLSRLFLLLFRVIFFLRSLQQIYVLSSTIEIPLFFVCVSCRDDAPSTLLGYMTPVLWIYFVLYYSAYFLNKVKYNMYLFLLTVFY